MLWKFILTCAALLAVTGAATARSPASTRVAAPPLATEAARVAGPEAALRDMARAFDLGQVQTLRQLRPQLAGHPLEVWAAYWTLRVRLEQAAADEVDAFLQRWDGTYLQDRLRTDWLLLLGSRGDWPTLARHLADWRMRDDPEVQCWALIAAAQLDGPAVRAASLLPVWTRQRSAGAACAQAARLGLQAGTLSAADLWPRARLAVLKQQSKTSQQLLDLLSPEGGTAAVLAQPQRWLAQHPLQPGDSQRAELSLLALARLAQRQPEAAAQTLRQGLAAALTPSQRAWAWGAVGLAGAQALHPQALHWFAQTPPQGQDDEQLAWRVRAALRALDWPDVARSVTAMSSAQADAPEWTYWLARAQLAQPGTDPAEAARARQRLAALAGVGGFYEILAAEALGQQLRLPSAPPPPSEAERASARANPGLQRALALFALGLRNEAVREWNYTTNLHTPGGMDDRSLLAAADLACLNAVWDRCINTSERTRQSFDVAQRYPTPHREALLTRTRQIGLDAASVYGLIRQESRFITDARSGVGASGLMQVMPKTARWTAKKIGLTDFHPSQLSDRDTNIAIGTGYLQLVLAQFDDQLALAAAAYNAGPARARAWRSALAQPVDAAIWAESIPFAETRDYVKKVTANSAVYAAVLGQSNTSLSQRLGRIAPRSANASSDLP